MSRAPSIRPEPAMAPMVVDASPEGRRRRDLELARRCLAGDRDAQVALFRRELDRVHLVLHRLLGGGADLEDAAQDTFLAFFQSLGRYRGDAMLSTWIDRIAVRTAIAHLERRRRTRAGAGGDEAAARLVDPARPAADTLADRELAARLYAALAELDPRQRVAFVLHVIEDRSMAEVAELMDASRVATKARVWRARRELARRAARDPVLASLLDDDGGTR